MANFSIRILSQEQRPLKGTMVRLEFMGTMRGISASKTTDKGGYARFHHYKEGQVRTFVNGRDSGTYRYEHGKSITIVRNND